MEREGEGFWARTYAVINEGTSQEMSIRIQQGTLSMITPGHSVSSSNAELYIERLRDLKALLNSLPEI